MSRENFRKISHPLFHYDHHIIYRHITPLYLFITTVITRNETRGISVYIAGLDRMKDL